MESGGLPRLIDAVYLAAEDERQWGSTLQQFGQALNAPAMALHFQTAGASPRGQVQCAIGIDQGLQSEYDAYYGSRNIWVNRGRHLIVENAVLTGEMICTAAELEGSEYYTDYLRRFDAFHSVAAIPIRQGNETAIVAGLRPRRWGPFTPDELTLVRLLVPHLRRAARLHRHLEALHHHQMTLVDALEWMPVGVVLFAAADVVTHVNSTARRLLAAAGCDLVPEGVRTPYPDDTQRLRQSVTDAVRRTGRCGGTFLVRRRAPHAAAVHVIVVPLSACHGLHASGRTAAAMFITDPDASPDADEAALRELYGLTPTEARVTAQLVRGANVTEIAQDRHTSEDTIRWVIKQVLRKTDSRNQAQAVGKVVTSLASRIAAPSRQADEEPTRHQASSTKHP